jgi:hypothetical protein
LPIALNVAPYLHKSKGAGTPIARNKNASKLFPHPYPRPPYIFGAKSGNAKPVRLRNWEAADAEAVYLR